MTVVFEQTPHLLQARTVLLCCYLLHFLLCYTKPSGLCICGVISILLLFFVMAYIREKSVFQGNMTSKAVFLHTPQAVAVGAGIFPNEFWPGDWC